MDDLKYIVIGVIAQSVKKDILKVPEIEAEQLAKIINWEIEDIKEEVSTCCTNYLFKYKMSLFLQVEIVFNNLSNKFEHVNLITDQLKRISYSH